MKVIIAQGNPGSAYQHTRHNVGFLLVSRIVEALGGTWKDAAKWKARISEQIINGEKVLFVLPNTFYNETGSSVRAILDFYKLNAATDLLVIHDELALPFGTIRTREKGSDAGNNGVKSINAAVGESYARIRIGVWNELCDRMDDADFVLSRFSAEESATLTSDIVPAVDKLVNDFIAGAHQSTSRRL